MQFPIRLCSSDIQYTATSTWFSCVPGAVIWRWHNTVNNAFTQPNFASRSKNNSAGLFFDWAGAIAPTLLHCMASGPQHSSEWSWLRFVQNFPLCPRWVREANRQVNAHGPLIGAFFGAPFALISHFLLLTLNERARWSKMSVAFADG